ncbi:MAG: SGNH/GDSL hydrolase family protein [Eubacteriales bacterium]|nr:SGNH/GDSL hydrolase family protein [Eubacteriales bacterium]
MMKGINLARLKQCMLRAETGGELTIGFLGGSITQGSLATQHENTYAYRVFSWWQKEFPDAEFHYVNGGIGGTTSHFGVSRAVTDVLMYQPDVVVVDFSVNDEADAFFQETYEGVIRRLLSWKSKPAVILLNNVFYDTGKNAQEYHNAVGDWYHIPHVSMKDTLYQKMKAGMYTREELTRDGLHPNDKGHELVAAEISAFLAQVKECCHENEEEMTLPEPLTANAYEHARRLTIREISPELDGFRADTEEKTGHLDFFKNGWIGRKAGDKILFEIPASCIAVQYRKTVAKPALRARLTLDGDAENAKILDGNFEEDWGDCLYLEPVLHHGENKMHIVELEIMEDKEEASPFYLLSLIIA